MLSNHTLGVCWSGGGGGGNGTHRIAACYYTGKECRKVVIIGIGRCYTPMYSAIVKTFGQYIVYSLSISILQVTVLSPYSTSKLHVSRLLLVPEPIDLVPESIDLVRAKTC